MLPFAMMFYCNKEKTSKSIEWKKLQQGFFIYQVICKTAEKQCCCRRKCELQNSPKWQSLFLSNNSHSVKEVLIRKKLENSSWDVWLRRLQFPCFSTNVEYFLQHFPKTSPSGRRLPWRGKHLSKQEKDYKPCSKTRPRSKLLEVQILAKIISRQFFMNVKARIEFLLFSFFFPHFSVRNPYKSESRDYCMRKFYAKHK